MEGLVTVSIVSHGHGVMLNDLARSVLCSPVVGQLIVTYNLPEPTFGVERLSDSRIQVIKNPSPLGFGANHNQAFRSSRSAAFCVLNPDIVLEEETFAPLARILTATKAGIVAPRVLGPNRAVEDSIRQFPTVGTLVQKALGGTDGAYRFPNAKCPLHALPVDWVAGMYMMFSAATYRHIRGFDERYFLYYEDVDACARVWRSGRSVMACPSVTVVHHARRSSHRHLRYLSWHLRSMTRYLVTHGIFKAPRRRTCG